MLTLWNQFDDLFNDDSLRARRTMARSFTPPVDIEEQKEAYVLTADVPGIKAEDIEITVEDGVLTMKGERRSESRQDKDGYRRYERSFGAFRRSFVLPKGVRGDRVEASVDNGQLMVRVPKPEAALPTKVTVTARSTVESSGTSQPHAAE